MARWNNLSAAEWEVWNMMKWFYRIVIFVFLLFCAAWVVSGFGDWRSTLLSLSILCALWFIIGIPVWIWGISKQSWPPLAKKLSIVLLVTVATGFTLYGLLKSRPNPSSLDWVGQIVFAVYFIASAVSAYFYWPGRSRKSGTSLRRVPGRKSRMKNKTYVTIPMITGTVGDVSMVFVNATFQKVNESKKRFPDPDFGAWLVEQIYHAKQHYRHLHL